MTSSITYKAVIMSNEAKDTEDQLKPFHKQISTSRFKGHDVNISVYWLGISTMYNTPPCFKKAFGEASETNYYLLKIYP